MKPPYLVALENAMKIGQNSDIPVNGVKAGLPKAVGQRTSASPVTSEAPAAKGVPVTVSSLAQAVGASASGEGEIDLGKVESVRTAIANGSYKVNAEAIADKLLSNAKEILKRPLQ